MRLPILLIVLGLLPAWPAAALDLPARRAGLWEIRIQGAGDIPGMTSQQCIDAKTDQQMNALGSGMSQEMCSKQDVRRSGDVMTIDSVCKVGSTTLVSQAVVTGDFNKAYTVKVMMHRDGADKQKSGATIAIAAKWLGACKPDQRPGDIIVAGGHKMNILDLQKMMGGQRPPGAPPPRP